MATGAKEKETKKEEKKEKEKKKVRWDWFPRREDS